MLWSLNSNAQQNHFKKVKGDAIHLEFNKWDTKTFVDLSFVKTFKNHLVTTTGISMGQYGDFVADGKTKNWYGNAQIPEYPLYTYLSSDIGGQAHFRVGYLFCLNRIFDFELNFGGALGVYDHKTESHSKYSELNYGEFVQSKRTIQINFGFGFDSKFLIRFSKKLYATIGVAMPFYVVNQDGLPIGKRFNPPLLGMSPSATIGVRYKFKTYYFGW
jgi:hypothetical protein